MSVYISYFQMIKFMRPWEVPLSTVQRDPEWFHEFQDQDHTFTDKNGVLNGMRAPMFAPNDLCNNLCSGDPQCTYKKYPTCTFKLKYMEQLKKMDAPRLVKYLDNISETFEGLLHLDRKPDFILIVHEAPSDPCSTRATLQRWFMNAGLELKEWEQPL